MFKIKKNSIKGETLRSIFKFRGWPRVWLGVSRSGADFEDFDGNKVTLSHWYLLQPDNHTAAGPGTIINFNIVSLNF